MSENFNYTELSNKWFELANDAYRTYVKSLIWGQERALELTKVLVGQAEIYSSESKAIFEEYAGQLQRAQQFVQTAAQESFKNTSEIVNQYRAATNANLSDLNERLDSLQTRIETAATKPSKSQAA